ncbi:MAG: putative ATP-grasp-modified RiPP [Pseudonocardiaceae bacterium]
MNRTADPQHVFSDNPLSSAAMRLALFPKASHGGLGPRRSQPFGLWHTASYPLPERPAVNYCHRQQVIVDDAGRSLVAQLDNAKPPPDPPTPPPKPKEWESKTYSDGDEGQEEDTWGWEEQP